MSETDILMWIQGASPWMDAPMELIALISSHAACWVLIAALLVLSKGSRRTGASVLLALVLVLLIVDVLIKPLVGRERPFEVCDFPLLIEAPTSFSFPSGHSAYSFAAATCMMLRDRRLGSAALVLAAVIAYSRLYLFVHWPTDVLAGAAIGVLLGALAFRFVDRLPDSVGTGPCR